MDCRKRALARPLVFFAQAFGAKFSAQRAKPYQKPKIPGPNYWDCLRLRRNLRLAAWISNPDFFLMKQMIF